MDLDVFRIKDILLLMKKEKTGFKYEEIISPCIKEIRRISTKNFNFAEVIFENLDEDLIWQIVNEMGLNFEKKKRTIDYVCQRCPVHKEHALDGDLSDTYLITKPRKFWVPALVADIVLDSMRIYDTKEGIELGSEILARYLEKMNALN